MANFLVQHTLAILVAASRRYFSRLKYNLLVPADAFPAPNTRQNLTIVNAPTDI
jgi:hypothetical protein